jgi:hypothetical protein
VTVKASGLAFADQARAILTQGYAKAYVAGKKDAKKALPKPVPIVDPDAAEAALSGDIQQTGGDEGIDSSEVNADDETLGESNPAYDPNTDSGDDSDIEDEYDDSGDDTLDEDGQQAVDDASGNVEDSLFGFGALLVGTQASIAQLDAWLGTYASTLNPLYEEGFQDGVQDGAEIEQATWVSEDDPAVCEDCKNLNGMTWVGNEIDAAMPHPGDSEFGGRTACGPNCFVEGTLVEGRFVSGMRSWYVGELIELRTMRGHRLTVTPNHPIATPAGFVPAHSLVEGNYVLSQLVVIDPSKRLDVENGPAAIEQVLEALKDGPSAWSGEWEPRNVDLHGDAVGVKGNVYVVGSDRKLLRGGNATSLEGLRKFSLVSSDMSVGKALSESPSSAVLVSERAARRGLPGRSEQVAGGFVSRGPSSDHALTAIANMDVVASEDGIDGRAWNLVGLSEYFSRDASLVEPTNDPVRQSIGLPVAMLPGSIHAVGAIAEIDARLSKPAGDSVDADTEFVRDMASRFPTLVSEDQIIEVVRRGGFEGHVYDLGAEGGWLSAGGIVAGNCRCSIDYTVIPLDQATYSWGGFDDNVEEMSTADLLKVWRILKYSEDQHRAALERELAALPKGRTWILPHN